MISLNTGMETLLLAVLTSVIPASAHAVLPSQFLPATGGDAGEVPSRVWVATGGDAGEVPSRVWVATGGDAGEVPSRVWVAPVGDDLAGDGTVQRPFATLSKAFEGNLGTSDDTLYVNVREGTYFMERLLDIVCTNTRPVVVRAVGGTPRFVGGRKVTGWERVDGGLYRAFIPEAFGGLDIGQFYVNGRRATLARTPDKGFFTVGKVEEHGFVPERGGYSLGLVRVRGGCTTDSACSSCDSVIGAMGVGKLAPKVRFHHKWNCSSYPVRAIERESGSFYILRRTLKPWNGIDSLSRFFFYGYPQALDSPGEWYYDRTEGYLYYYPLPGEDMAGAECIVPVLKLLMRIRGTEERHICNIRFEGISFECSSFVAPADGILPEQAAASAPAAIELDYADNIVFRDCEICHTGAYALWIRNCCHGCEVSRCLLTDLGAGGVKIGTLPSCKDVQLLTAGNAVDNNIITHGGYELPAGVGVGIFHSIDNHITHNEISDLGYSGVSIGWEWGYTPAQTERNVVEYNHIHHIGRGELSDMGGIYAVGSSEGIRICHNVVHDVVSYGYGGWGLYTDEGSTHVLISHNLVYRCKCGGFHQNYGKENVVENNIFAYSDLQQIDLTKAEEHRSLTFDRNIVLQERGTTGKGPWGLADIEFGKNLFWTEGSQLLFGNSQGGTGLPESDIFLDFETFRKDIAPGSVNADPLFVDSHGGDFRFRSFKAARTVGFVPFDYTEAGVYGSSEWLEMAK